MSRATVRKVFVTGLVLLVVGGVLLLLAVRTDAGATSPLGEAGALLAGFGGLLDFASWLMALISSAILGRWGWFAVVLVLGLLGLPLLVMIVYSLAGPSRRREPRRRAVAT